MRRHVEPHRLVTVGRRWYLLGYDLDRQDWRSFRLDRLSEPFGTRSRFRAREVPGGDAAAYVRKGLSRNETRVVVRALVQAPAEQVEQRTGRWATVTPVDDNTCRVEMDAVQPAVGGVRAGRPRGAVHPRGGHARGARAALRLWAARFTRRRAAGGRARRPAAG